VRAAVAYRGCSVHFPPTLSVGAACFAMMAAMRQRVARVAHARECPPARCFSPPDRCRLLGRPARLRCHPRMEVYHRQGQGRFKAVIDASGEGVVLFDGLGTVVLWKPAATEMFGHPAWGVGRHFTSFFAPLTHWPGGGAQAGAGRRKFERSFGMWQSEEAAYFAKFRRDGTQRSRSRGVLRTASEDAEGILEAASLMVLDPDARRAAKALSRVVETMLGYGRDELVWRNWFQSIVPLLQVPEERWMFSVFLSAEAVSGAFHSRIPIRSVGECRISCQVSRVLVRRSGREPTRPGGSGLRKWGSERLPGQAGGAM
jgi:PAS domain-containing protein